jgi:hypothetical protein
MDSQVTTAMFNVNPRIWTADNLRLLGRCVMAVVFLSDYSEYNGVLCYEYRNCRNRDRPREHSRRGIPPKNDYHANFIALRMFNPANRIPDGR